MPARFALYYAPEPGSDLDGFGAAWLGRDARTGEAVALPAAYGLDERWQRVRTDEPRRYGFHATLKPPFALRAGTDAAALRSAAERFAAATAAFDIPPLRLSRLGRFLALVPSAPSPALAALAAAAVRELDGFREPPSAAELQRRRRANLSPRQEELLGRWGYPYVFEEFRFHLTLTGGLDIPDLDRIEAVLGDHVAMLCRQPLRIAAVWLFEQVRAEAPFRAIARLPLAR